MVKSGSQSGRMARSAAGVGEEMSLAEARIAGHELNLSAQPVCAVTVSLVACTVAEALAGSSVKVKCRAAGATFMKTPAGAVPAGGGAVQILSEPAFMIYEGEDALVFELCEARLFRPSTALATGKISFAKFFAGTGVAGQKVSRSVQLLAEDGRPLATVTVGLCYDFGRLASFGGYAALRACALPPSPGHGEIVAYCHACDAARIHLQEAYLFARMAKAAPHASDKAPRSNF